MLVQLDSPSSERTSVVPSIMDSPTLARVERAMQRNDETGSFRNHDTVSLNRSVLAQSLIPSNFGKDSSDHAIKRGLLWQQRDRLFSRWKERYFILTRDYLHCFRRASGTDRISEMGQFLFKIKLVDVEKVEWINKKTYSTVTLELGRDGKILLRAPEGLEDWFELLEECTLTSKERRRALRVSHDMRKKENNNSINSSLEEWLASRQKSPGIRIPSSSASNSPDDEVVLRRKDRRSCSPVYNEPFSWSHQDASDNRLSLLTDIDISSYDGTIGSPSIASFRISEDVICVSRTSRRYNGIDGDNSSLRGSFRGANHRITAPPTTNLPNKIQNGNVHSQGINPQLIKFRERSHSDIQRIDRRPWLVRDDCLHRAYN